MTLKKVTFNNELHIITEPVDISYDLHLTRIDIYKHKQADQHRMERLLTPILTKEHRHKMYVMINKM
jgi:hypothetical protein